MFFAFLFIASLLSFYLYQCKIEISEENLAKLTIENLISGNDFFLFIYVRNFSRFDYKLKFGSFQFVLENCGYDTTA